MDGIAAVVAAVAILLSFAAHGQEQFADLNIDQPGPILYAQPAQTWPDQTYYPEGQDISVVDSGLLEDVDPQIKHPIREEIPLSQLRYQYQQQQHLNREEIPLSQLQYQQQQPYQIGEEIPLSQLQYQQYQQQPGFSDQEVQWKQQQPGFPGQEDQWVYQAQGPVLVNQAPMVETNSGGEWFVPDANANLEEAKPGLAGQYPDQYNSGAYPEVAAPFNPSELQYVSGSGLPGQLPGQYNPGPYPKGPVPEFQYNAGPINQYQPPYGPYYFENGPGPCSPCQSNCQIGCSGIPGGDWDDGKNENDDDNGVPPFVRICDNETCSKSCQDSGFPEGACFALECFCKKEEEVDWTYEKQEDWKDKYPGCDASSSERQQSPINMESKKIRDLARKVNLENYGTNFSMIVENTGHGVRLLVQSAILPAIQVAVDDGRGGELPRFQMRKYVLAGMDLHWGSSEHAIDGQREDAELQLHHFDITFDSFEDAIKEKDGVVSVAVLFRVNNTAKPDLSESLFTVLGEVTKPGDLGVVSDPGRHLQFLNDQLSDSFGLYEGTLPYPPCSANINWMVAKDVFHISEQQIKLLQTVEDVRGNPILKNARDLQN